MAPVCSNCNGTDFVWANELKTGMTGASLSLRARGEVPLGTRICRTCGHADLFLRDISILHQPHNWRPGEFVPIVAKSSAPKPSHSPRPPEAPSPPPPPPASPHDVAPPPPPPPPAPAPVVAPEPVTPAPATAAEGPAPAAEPATPSQEETVAAEATSAKPKPRRRAAKPKA